VTRIVAGSLGGRRLAAPPGSRTRPTSDRVREALFNTLQSVTELADARFADLYAGSGAIGLEACSRGASSVLLVESNPAAARTARANIVTLGVADLVSLVVADVSAFLAAGETYGGRPYDIVFADPPYATPEAQLVGLQRALLDGGWLAADAVVVIERATRSGPVPWVDPITELRTRRYGETTLWYGRRP
jgi:16S rRNA (guanine966-N2)-methyltransferase